MIDPKFLDHEIYSIYKAALRLVGPEKQEEIVHLSGEIMFSELENEIDFSQISDPIELIKRLQKYLVDVGYFAKGEVEKISENELILHLHEAKCHDGVVKLKNEGGYPPHFMTMLIFGGLKKMFNIKVDLTHLSIGKEPPYHSVEKWKLIK
jgi:hypothetical protein